MEYDGRLGIWVASCTLPTGDHVAAGGVSQATALGALGSMLEALAAEGVFGEPGPFSEN